MKLLSRLLLGVFSLSMILSNFSLNQAEAVKQAMVGDDGRRSCSVGRRGAGKRRSDSRLADSGYRKTDFEELRHRLEMALNIAGNDDRCVELSRILVECERRCRVAESCGTRQSDKRVYEDCYKELEEYIVEEFTHFDPISMLISAAFTDKTLAETMRLLPPGDLNYKVFDLGV